MTTAEYMKAQYKHIPEDICIQYKLQAKVAKDKCIYINVKNEEYDLM